MSVCLLIFLFCGILALVCLGLNLEWNPPHKAEPDQSTTVKTDVTHLLQVTSATKQERQLASPHVEQPSVEEEVNEKIGKGIFHWVVNGSKKIGEEIYHMGYAIYLILYYLGYAAGFGMYTLLYLLTLPLVLLIYALEAIVVRALL